MASGECHACGEEYARLRQHWSMSDCPPDPEQSSKVTLECDECGEPFERWRYRVDDGPHYCSHECKDAATREGEYRECATCGGEVYVPPSRLESMGEYSIDRHFCDKECEAAYRKEHWVGENHPQYNGGTVTTTCEVCGDEYEVTPALEESSRFCSMECHGTNLGKTKDNAGPANPAWKGGKGGIHAVRRLLTDRSWFDIRRRILSRVGRECQMCGATAEDGQIHLHHIVPIAAGGTNSDWNLLAVCPSCHRRAEEFIDQYTTPHLYKFAE